MSIICSLFIMYAFIGIMYTAAQFAMGVYSTRTIRQYYATKHRIATMRQIFGLQVAAALITFAIWPYFVAFDLANK